VADVEKMVKENLDQATKKNSEPPALGTNSTKEKAM
jgi:hypothetical protein